MSENQFALPQYPVRKCAHMLLLFLALLMGTPQFVGAQPAPVTGNNQGQPVNPITQNGTFTCDVPAGSITVKFSSGLEVFDGPRIANTVRAGAGDFYTISAGMTITAQVTPETAFTGLNWAWMQAVTSYASPTTVEDANGNFLTAPFPDTPPGGYRFIPFNREPAIPDPWDREPWYGNNSINQLSLYDQPKSYYSPVMGPTVVNFESWLVCVTAAQGPAPGNYTVLPLVGFTWGFAFGYGTDANGNQNGTTGDDILEYTGVTSFGGFTQGGQPSKDFKDGYAKSWNITYLNNPQDCELCLATQAPEPGAVHLILFLMVTGSGLLAAGMLRLRQEI